MTDERILVVDDERDITALVAYHLAKAGYRVTTAATGPAALEAVAAEPPDLVVLDLMLPGRSGYEVLEELRRNEGTQGVGVILLTARREEADRIRGLASGADDYLTKPFSPEELVLRVGAVLRRLQSPAAAAGGTILKTGPIAIDRAAHTVSIAGEPVDLTRIEYRLLLLLAERRGRVQTRPQLLASVWEGAGRHPDAHRGHARPAPARQARRGRRPAGDGARRGLPHEGRAHAMRCVR